MRHLKVKFSLNFYTLSFITFIFINDKSYKAFFGILFAIFHEFGHLYMLYILKIKVIRVSFKFLNIEILSDELSEKSLKNILVFLAGPAVNLILALFLEILNIYLKNDFVLILFFQNIFLGIFNLLPFSFLDGGRILKIFILNTPQKNKIELVIKATQFITIFILILEIFLLRREIICLLKKLI